MNGKLIVPYEPKMIYSVRLNEKEMILISGDNMIIEDDEIKIMDKKNCVAYFKKENVEFVYKSYERPMMI